ncbi:hypothetical protein BC834DRAFT_792666, partial [Gloeopeniophorella convolvens]
LPNEILDAVFDHLSQDTLTRVALVSRRWRAVAERLIYTSVVISEVVPRTSPTVFKGLPTMPAVPALTLRCCETLSSYPHLADAVRRFHLRWQTASVESPALLLVVAQNIVQTLVPTLAHLESLDLAFGLAEHVRPAPPLPPFRLPALRSLALQGIGAPLEPVLRAHPALQHLKLSDCPRPLRLRADDVPHLASFRGCPAQAAAVLPGRPVQALGLVGDEPFVSERDLAGLAAGSAPLRSLDLSGMSVTPTLLRDVSRHLSHIEWLKVRLALRHTLHYALSGIRLLAALTTVLGAFRNLRGLDLSPTNTEMHLCVAWTGACPSLRRVVFPSRTEW